jgi:hypothetical protein
MDAQQVDVEDAPPVARVDLPGGLVLVADARVGDRQVDWLQRDRAGTDLACDRLDLLAGGRSDSDVPAVLGELPGDIRPDPASPRVTSARRPSSPRPSGLKRRFG